MEGCSITRYWDTDTEFYQICRFRIGLDNNLTSLADKKEIKAMDK